MPLNLAILAGEANTMDAASFRAYASARLATGHLPYHGAQKLSERVDSFVGKVLTSVNAPSEIITGTIGAFAPSPPEYTEPLLELVSRLAADAATTAALPRQMDAVIFERIVRRREASDDLMRRLGCTAATERQVRLISAFLRGQFDPPEAVQKVLQTPMLPTSILEPTAPEQPALFDAEQRKYKP